MQTSTLTRTIVTAVIALGVAPPATPALGDVFLHRDGSKAVPFRAYPAASQSPRRDAAVGAGAGLILALLGVAVTGAYAGRRARTA